MTRRGWLVPWVVVAACAARQSPDASEPPGGDADDGSYRDASLDLALARARATAKVRATTLSPVLSRTRRLQSPTSDPDVFVGLARAIDVRFRDADLENALAFLADAGGFSLVTEGDLSGRVSIDLVGVRPYDALHAIAEAHGARVATRGHVVIVTK